MPSRLWPAHLMWRRSTWRWPRRLRARLLRCRRGRYHWGRQAAQGASCHCSRRSSMRSQWTSLRRSSARPNLMPLAVASMPPRPLPRNPIRERRTGQHARQRALQVQLTAARTRRQHPVPVLPWVAPSSKPGPVRIPCGSRNRSRAASQRSISIHRRRGQVVVQRRLRRAAVPRQGPQGICQATRCTCAPEAPVGCPRRRSQRATTTHAPAAAHRRVSAVQSSPPRRSPLPLRRPRGPGYSPTHAVQASLFPPNPFARRR